MPNFKEYLHLDEKTTPIQKNKKPVAKKPDPKPKVQFKKKNGEIEPASYGEKVGGDKARFDMIQKLTNSGWEHASKSVYVNKSTKQRGRLTGTNFELIGDEDLSPKERRALRDYNTASKRREVMDLQNKDKMKQMMQPSPAEQKKKQDDEALKTGIAPSYMKNTKERAKWYFENGGKDRRLHMNSKEKEELDKLIDKDEIKEKKKVKTKNQVRVQGKTEKYPTKISGKDKSLDEKVNTSKEKAFTETLYDPKKGDNAFYKKTKRYQGKNISVEDKWDPPLFLDNGKVPKRDIQVLQRMMNTKAISSTEPPISFFTSGGPGGMGKIQAQAGELMSIMFTSSNDKEKKELQKSIEEHISNQDEKTSIITKDWLKAAINNSTAIHNRIKSEFGVDDASSVITHCCWDVKEEVEAMGLKDYNNNKGFSTDIYIKLELPNGQKILNEVSLKKDKNVFFLNSTTGKLEEWDEDLPNDLKMKTHVAKVKKYFSDGIDKNKINRLLQSSSTPEIKELQKLMKKKNIESIDSVIVGNNRTSRKVLLVALEALAAHGDEKAIKSLDRIEKAGRSYSMNAIKAIGSNKKLKEGMLKEVKSEFPIKAVAHNEETMAIGDMSVDRKVVKKIFGTDDWDEIQEHLDAVTDKTPPYLAYKIKGTKKTIPIAVINIREDGVNYGGTFKFEMALHKDFAKTLKNANNDLYKKQVDESTFIYRWSIISNYKIEEDD